MTPPEVARVGAGSPDRPGWQVRVVPNLYPIVGEEPGVPGAHEVLVCSPAHDAQLDALSLDDAAAVLLALRDRSAHHLDAGLAHAQPIVNYGRASGASIEHPHAQLIAVAFTPPLVDMLHDRFVGAGRDLVTDAISGTREGPFLVRDAAAVTWCPPGAISPFRVRIALESGGARFDRATDGEVRVVTEALQDTLARLHSALDDIAYNVVVNTAGRDDRPFHWWVEVVPRVNVIGGFEMGTGVWVNTMPPETAASVLRDA